MLVSQKVHKQYLLGKKVFKGHSKDSKVTNTTYQRYK